MRDLKEALGLFVFMWTLSVISGTSDMSDFKECRGVDIDLTEDHVMHMNECLKEAGAKEVLDIEPSNMPCFGKCVFSKKGLIDTNGHPHKEKIMGLITDRLPKEIHEDLDKRITECLLPETTEMIDPEDDSCATYMPVLMCIHIAFLEECEK